MTDAAWWKFWKWHIHRCQTNSDDLGVWGECIVCHKRFGYVTREELRAYIDRDIAKRLRKEQP